MADEDHLSRLRNDNEEIVKAAVPSGNDVTTLDSQAISLAEGTRTVGRHRQDPPDIDATEVQWCPYCTVRPVDPDYQPYCSAFCAIDAEEN